MFIPLCALAQNVNVHGTVTDGATGEEVIGATVKVKGSTGGTITDAMGNYSISVAPGSTLEFSYVGYNSTTAKVTKGGVIDIKLTENATMMDEVVVVGYGVMKRSDLTGSVS